jgi:uncharacterized membrane protein YkoI
VFDWPDRPLNAFFERALEAMLKDAFIHGSGATADNRRVQTIAAAPASRIAIATAVLLGLALASPWADGSDDHDRARAAVQAGQVLPLPTLLERLQRSHPGQVLELELEKDDGRWIYELKLLQADGQLLKLKLDAASAQVLDVKRKDERKARRGDESGR